MSYEPKSELTGVPEETLFAYITNTVGENDIWIFIDAYNRTGLGNVCMSMYGLHVDVLYAWVCPYIFIH